MIDRRLFALLVCAAALAPLGAPLAAPAPLSPAGRTAIEAALKAQVDTGTIKRGALLVAQGGRILDKYAAGVADPASGRAMTPDTAIGFQSMSKVVTAAAVMILVDEGKLSLDDKVSKYVPEFGALQVKVLKPGSPPPPPPGPAGAGMPPAQYDLVPAAREMTLRDVITHSAGLNPGIPPLAPNDTLATGVPKTALPLEYQPGTRFLYTNTIGFDLLSRVVEVASGQDYDSFLKQRLFGPLGTRTLRFGPQPDMDTQGVPINPAMMNDVRIAGRTFFSGGAGMTGTLEDYWRFAQMLADDGRAGGKRILSAKAVAQMHTSLIGDLFTTLNGRPASPPGALAFGTGVAIVVDPKAAKVDVPAGSYGWSGGGGSRFWISPKEDRVLIVFAENQGAQRAVEKAALEALGQ